MSVFEGIDGSQWAEARVLRSEGWPWRQAIFIVWSATPARDRWPRTQQELAEILGLRSDRQCQRWVKERPEISDRIRELQAAPLMAHRRDAFEALAAVATTPAPSGNADRRLFFELNGDYRPRGELATVGDEDGGSVRIMVKNGR